MPTIRKLNSQDVALTVCFTALYVVFSFMPLSQVIGLGGKSITAATILALIIGIIIGPYLGLLSSFCGGVLALFFNLSFSPPSLVAGIVASLFSGWLSNGNRGICVLTYFSLLFFFGFFPSVGPVWLYPPLMWFQIVGFLILISPVQSKTFQNLNSRNNTKFAISLFIIFLVSTLASQIAGSLLFEVVSWPIFVIDTNAWKTIWKSLTFLYPVERLIIASVATLLGVPIYKILRNADLLWKTL